MENGTQKGTVMSFEDDLKDVGDSIGKLVDNAVNSQDFQELNRKIYQHRKILRNWNAG